MYLNNNKLFVLRDNLRRDCGFLSEKKESLDRQIDRLSLNTQTEQIVAEMKKTSRRLDEQIYSAKVMIAILERVEEVYSKGEDRIAEHIEDGSFPQKMSFLTFREYPGAELFRGVLRQSE